MTGELLCVGLSHHQTPVHLREKVGFSKDKLGQALGFLKSRPEIEEGLILSTCNRVELYAHASSSHAFASLENFISDFHQIPFRSLGPHFYRFQGNEAAMQFFKVASSLDSLVLGEAQILGQVKDAIQLAREAKTIGPHLNLMLNHALMTAKRIRTETQIACHSISVSHIAVELIESVFSSIKGRNTLLVGAGAMAEVAARCLSQKGAHLHIANRSLEHAQSLALSLGAMAYDLNALDSLLSKCDIIMTSANSTGYLISQRKVQQAMRRRRYKPIFFVDIAVPRNIDPEVAHIDGAYLYNIDDLSDIANTRLKLRSEHSLQARHIIEEELLRFQVKKNERRVAPLIASLSEKGHTLADDEVTKCLRNGRLHFSTEQEAHVRQMAHAIVNKLLHEPILEMKSQIGKEKRD